MAVTPKLMSYFKNLYGGHKIIYVRFSDNEFVFRTLSKAEYRTVKLLNKNPKDCADAICNAACIYPEGYDFGTCGFAGVPDFAADKIEYYSGFKDVQTILDFYRNAKKINNLETQAMDLIKAFIPEYTYEEMKDWTWQKLMETAVRAESVAVMHHYDWHLEDQSEQYEKDMADISSDNKEFIDELYNNGVDPMNYFSDEIEAIIKAKRNVVTFPLITSGKWNNEEVLNAVRKQAKSNIQRR